MEITLLHGILLALMVFVVAIDSWWEGFFIFRPIIVCTLAGLIVGDLRTGLLAGGLVELAFAGITPVGGVTPPDPIMTSVMTVIIATTTGQNVATSFAIAIPFGLLMQYIGTFMCTIYAFFNPVADRYARKANVDAIVRLSLLLTFVYAFIYGVVAFLSTYVMQDAMVTLVNSMPEFLIHGFGVAGGLIPAIGFSLLLNVMLRKQYFGYLLAGFIFVCFIPVNNVLPIAVMGLAFALNDYYRNTDDGEKKGAETNEGI
jgi:PTS system galactosamine-specific IIC component